MTSPGQPVTPTQDANPPFAAAYGLDRQPLYVKSATAGAEAEELREEYILARRLAGSTWQDPVAYRKYRTSEFMMTALEGARTLAELPRPQVHELPDILYPILEALRRVHVLGYTYVDLKPEHVFVDYSTTPPRVLLIDLGGCVPTGTKARMYTAGYSAPEAIGGDVVDDRSDLYSFGAILAFLLTGEHYFQGETLRDVLTQQFLGDSHVSAEGPVVLETLLRDLLSSTPRHRPGSTREVERRLHQLWPRDLLGGDASLSLRKPTIARDQEDARFLEWLDRIETTRDLGEELRPWKLTVSGEPHVGLHRCVSVWLAVSETRGWVPSSVASSGQGQGQGSSHDRWVLTRYDEMFEVGATISLQTRLGEPGPEQHQCTTEARDRSPARSGLEHDEGDDFTIEVGPLRDSDLERLASVQLESGRLRARLARLSLGNPGLLAALLPRVSPLCDFLNTGPISDRSYEEQGTPQPFLDWCRWLLQRMPHPTRESLVEKAVRSFLLETPNAFLESAHSAQDDLEPTVGSPGSAAPLERFTQEASHPFWAEAVLRLDPSMSSECTCQLVGDPQAAFDRTPTDPYRLALLCVLLEDDALITDMIPAAIHRLLDEERWRDAALVFSIGLNSSKTPGRLLEQIDLERLSIVLAVKCTGAALSQRSKDTLLEHAASKNLVTQEAARLLSVLGMKEEDATRSIVDLSGERPTTPAAERSWLLHRVLYVRSLWKSQHALDVGVDPFYLALAAPSSHAIMGYSLYECGFRDDASLPTPLRRILLLILAGNAVARDNYDRWEGLVGVLPECCRDSIDPGGQRLLHQLAAALAYETGRAEECRAHAWASLQSDHTAMALSLANLALVDLDAGRFGSALQLAERAVEDLAADPGQQGFSSASSQTRFVFQRLGQMNRVPAVPAHLDIEEVDPAWLEADAYRLLPHEPDAGRARLRSLVGAQVAGSERVDQLAEWMLAEIDLGNRDFALDLADELNGTWREAAPRCEMKVRLATCSLGVCLPGPPAGELERMVERNYEELKSSDWRLYTWRAARNRAVFMDKSGAKDEAASAWRLARGLVDDLLASFGGNRSAAEAFEQTPAIQAFYRDSRRGEDNDR